MISAQALSHIRTVAFTIGGFISALYALTAVFPHLVGIVPHWLPLMTALSIGAIIFVTAALAGAQNAQASLDESYTHDQRLAASLGFWAALASGTALMIFDLGGELKLAITLTSASTVFFGCHVLLELRGHR